MTAAEGISAASRRWAAELDPAHEDVAPFVFEDARGGRMGAGFIDPRVLRETSRETREDHPSARGAILSERAAWRALLGDEKPDAARLPPPRLLYQRAPLSPHSIDRATLRACDGEGHGAVRVEVVERDREGTNGWSPMAWTEYAHERETPAGEGLGLVRSWVTRPRPASRAATMDGAAPVAADRDPADRDPVWTLYTPEGEALAVIDGAPEELHAARDLAVPAIAA